MLQSNAIIKIIQSSGGYNDSLSGSQQTFQQLYFTDYNSVEINNSWDNLEQTAKITIPRKVRKVIGNTITGNFDVSNNVIINDLTNPLYRFISHDITVGASGSKFNKLSDGLYYRTNPLVEVGDVITIQLGYIIRNNGEYNTLGDYSIPFNGLLSSDDGGNNGTLYIDENFDIQQSDGEDNSDLLFYGYVTGVNVTIDGNIIIDCEDYMWYLKKARIPNKIYNNNDPKNGTLYKSINDTKGDFFTNPKGYSINSMLYDMMGNDGRTHNVLDIISSDNIQQGNTASGIQNLTILPIPLNVAYNSSFTMNSLPLAIPKIDFTNNVDTIIGDVTLQNGPTIYEFLKTLKNEYEIPSFFLLEDGFYRLYCSTFVYDDRLGADGESSISRPSGFQQYQFGTNIIESNLEWKDNSTINAGAIVKSLYLQGLLLPDLSPVKTKKDKLKKNLSSIPVAVGDPNGPQYTFFYTTSNATIANGKDSDAVRKAMREWGQKQLDKVAYTGYYGTFTTFLYPYVKWGDIIYISDPNIPERNGFYYVKRVITRANFEEGSIQEITIDYKLAIGDPNNFIKK